MPTDFVDPMELNVHPKTQKEVGVLLKDSTQSLLNAFKKINLSVFPSEVGLIPLILAKTWNAVQL